MKTVQKVLLSLLLATVVFTGFAIAAYSGLFSVIDTRFYNQRIRANTQALLDESQDVVSDYTRRLQQEIGAVAANPAITNVFLVNQSRQDIEEQNQLIGTLLDTRPEIDYIRIVDNEQGRLWFSTLETDIRNRTEVSVEYRPVSELDPPLSLPAPETDSSRAAWIPDRGALRVTVPMVDSFSIPRGTLVAWVGTSGVFSRLVDAGIIGPSNRVRLTPQGTLIVNAPRHLDGADLEEVDQALSEDERLPVIDSSLGSSFAIESVASSNGLPRLIYLLNEDELEMDTPLQIILLASVFLLTFIVGYLVLNIRQDPTVVVAERFRRFQESVVKDYLREGRAVDPELWQRELESRKEQIEREMKRGLGRVSGDTREHVEQSMQQSWDELSRLLGTSGGGQRAQLEPVSLKQIEEIIERTLARYGEAPTSPSRSVPQRSVQPIHDSPSAEESSEVRSRRQPADEEIEELEDLDELDEAQELNDAEERDASDEAEEELSELEELEDLEELDESDEVEPAEAEEPVDLEELDESDEGEPAGEAVAELSELDEIEDLDEAEELDEVEPAEAEELDEVDEVEPAEAEELDEVDEVEPAEAEELDEVEPAEAEELDEVEPADVEGPAEAEELDEAEELEELGAEEFGEDTAEGEELEELETEELPEEVAEAEEPVDLEELDASDVEEPALEAVEELSELDEIEDLDEAEELDEVEPADVEELDDVEPAEAEELDEIDEVEPAEAEELDEADELEELGAEEFGEDAAAVEELEELETEELPEEVAEAVEPVDLEELDASDVEEPAFEAVAELGELDEIEDLDEAEELDEVAEELAEEQPEIDGFADIDQLTPLDEEVTQSPASGETPAPSDDWFEISSTALELAEDGENGSLAPAATLGGHVTGNDRMDSDDRHVLAGDAAREDVLELEELEASEKPGEGAEDDDVVELELVEELDEAEELKDAEELDFAGELEDIEAIEEVAELEVVADDDEDVEELEDDLAADDESDPVDVEEVDHQPAPFFSALSSFGSSANQMQWRSEAGVADRPSVYRADEIRPETVAIRGIENTNTHHVVDLDDFVAFAGKNQTVIEERDGIIRIEASAYFGEYRDVDQRTQALADQVMTRHTAQGIDDVFGSSFGDLDFADILGGDQATSADVPDTPDSPLRVVSGGFELPYVTVAGDSGVRQVYRQLVRLTRRWDARVALLLEETPDHGMRGGFGLGLPEECPDQIMLGPDSDLARTIVPYQRVALLKQPMSAFRDFAGSCQAQKLSAINNWLLLPLKNVDHRRYLMVGFSRSFDDLMDLSVQYEIIPRAV